MPQMPTFDPRKEVRVQAFEGEAWLRSVLEAPEGPALANYLEDRLNEIC